MKSKYIQHRIAMSPVDQASPLPAIKPMTDERSFSKISIVENLSRETILAFLRDHRQALAERFGVRRIGLFGSFADDRQNVDSDIDLFVEMDEADFIRLVELQDFLEAALQHRVDIIRTSRDIQTPFRRRIESQAIYA